MPDILDVFNEEPFSTTALTAAVNKQPYVPGQIGSSGVFEEEGIDTTSVVIEELNGTLALIAPSPRGGPGETVDNEKRKARSFLVPHFQRDDSVMADEISSVRAFGSATELETIEMKVQQKLAKHVRGLDATLEHLRVGAIKGIILDKNGNTLLNLFDEFGVTAPSDVDFTFSVSTTNIRQTIFDVIITIEDALEATNYDAIDAYCGKTFWKQLIEHKSVKDTYLNTVQAQELRGSPGNYQFEFGGVNWVRYRTGSKASTSAGGAFIGDSDCRFVVRGVPGLFMTRFSPGDYVDTVNTIGLPRYSQQYRMANNKGISLELQSNPLNVCTQPGVLVKGVAN